MRYYITMKEKLSKAIGFLLDFILPRSDEVKILESLKPEEFKKRVFSETSGEHPASGTLILFPYAHPLVRQAVWELKYRGNKKIARLLAACLYEKLREKYSENNLPRGGSGEKLLLLPIPLSKQRRKERGFNQCELLTDGLSEIDRGALFETDNNLFVKIKDTPSQTKNSRAARLRNLSGCFALAEPGRLLGRHVVIIDDVMTTGATLEEAKKVLLQGGVKKVTRVAIAH